jgi:mycofactocin precursor
MAEHHDLVAPHGGTVGVALHEAGGPVEAVAPLEEVLVEELLVEEVLVEEVSIDGMCGVY